jgi:hypothetical protein
MFRREADLLRIVLRLWSAIFPSQRDPGPRLRLSHKLGYGPVSMSSACSLVPYLPSKACCVVHIQMQSLIKQKSQWNSWANTGGFPTVDRGITKSIASKRLLIFSYWSTRIQSIVVCSSRKMAELACLLSTAKSTSYNRRYPSCRGLKKLSPHGQRKEQLGDQDHMNFVWFVDRMLWRPWWTPWWRIWRY